MATLSMWFSNDFRWSLSCRCFILGGRHLCDQLVSIIAPLLLGFGLGIAMNLPVLIIPPSLLSRSHGVIASRWGPVIPPALCGSCYGVIADRL
ncbi:hypothetical protein EYF80_012344 [Liparis tanakae]|uniref:Uncharacterized protein n=1 Tax=Liparis tanakae TaxID=230148 RepID=A0A4Z2IHE2_9TELE|nr:hypothetical protein EYF80_012344 [Liparis tanakae]